MTIMQITFLLVDSVIPRHFQGTSGGPLIRNFTISLDKTCTLNVLKQKWVKNGGIESKLFPKLEWQEKYAGCDP